MKGNDSSREKGEPILVSLHRIGPLEYLHKIRTTKALLVVPILKSVKLFCGFEDRLKVIVHFIAIIFGGDIEGERNEPYV